MGFVPKDWINETDHAGPPASPPGTPYSAAAMEDVETRLSDYSEQTARQDMGIYDVVQYGADPTGATYSDTAFADALDAIRALDTDALSKGATLHIPFGTYKLANSLHIDRGMVVQGVSGAGWYSGSVLRFDSGVPGIIVDSYDTSPSGGRGNWSTIRDLHALSDRTTPGGDGIQLKGRAWIERVYIREFSGNGLSIDNQTFGGNANTFRVESIRIDNCGGHGVIVRGNDSNAGIGINIDCSNNGMNGLYDSSFLGCTWLGCTTHANGAQAWTPSHTTTLSAGIDADDTTIPVVSTASFDDDGGCVQIDSEKIVYTGVTATELTGCIRGFVTTAASHLSSATVTEKWGGFRSNGSQNVSNFIGCYTEGSQGCGDVMNGKQKVVGHLGVWGAGQESGASTLNTFKERWILTPSLSVLGGPNFDADTDPGVGIGGQPDADERPMIGMGNGSYGSWGWTWWNDVWLELRENRTTAGMRLAGVGASSGSRSMTRGDVEFPNGFFIQGGGGYTAKVAFTESAHPPTGGKRGDVTFNITPSAGGKVGWVCVSDGTWKEFGVIDS